LCRRFRVRRLELFGSGARGGFDPARSDLDFLVEFEDLAFGEHYEAYFGLLESLQDLFGRQIDLVVSRAIKNRYFRMVIDRDKVLMYAA